MGKWKESRAAQEAGCIGDEGAAHLVGQKSPGCLGQGSPPCNRVVGRLIRRRAPPAASSSGEGGQGLDRGLQHQEAGQIRREWAG